MFKIHTIQSELYTVYRATAICISRLSIALSLSSVYISIRYKYEYELNVCSSYYCTIEFQYDRFGL